MNPSTSFMASILILAGLFLVSISILSGLAIGSWESHTLALAFFGIAVMIGLSLKIAGAWQKFVALKMGKLQNVKDQGMFVIILVFDNVFAVIDDRIQRSFRKKRIATVSQR